MSSLTPPDARDQVQRLLQSQPDRVHYDVEAGLARHRQLVAEKAALPDWAKEPRGFGRTALRGIVLTGVMLGTGFLLFPRNEAPAPVAATSHADAAQPSVVITSGAVTTPLPVQTAPVVTRETPSPTPARAHVARALTARARKLAAANAKTSSPTRETASATAAAPATAPLLMQNTTQSSHSHSVSILHPAPEPAEPHAVSPAPPAPVSAVVADAAPVLSSGGGEVRSAPLAVQRPQIQPTQPEVLLEMEQLKLAERLLPREPKRTLSIVRAGLEQFHPGYLTQERRYLEVMALRALGSADEARMRGRAFLRDYPQGPYRRKVEHVLEAEPGRSR